MFFCTVSIPRKKVGGWGISDFNKKDSFLRALMESDSPEMGGHNSYTFTGNTSQLSYRALNYLDSIKALRKEALV